MALFDIIPEDLFSILASPNRRLYMEALEVLWALYQDRIKISKKLYLEHLIEGLELKNYLDSFEEEEMSQEERANIRGKASFLIRKIKEKGWIEEELSPDYETFFTVPDYSSKLLNLFQNLQTTENHSGFSYVYGTYSVLKTADSEQEASGRMQALNIAYDNTQELIKLLKKIYHNMKRYIKSHIDLENANDVISMYYDDFIENISKKYIAPLKLKESIPKYRNSIQNIMMSWLEEENLRHIVTALMLETQSKDFQESASAVKQKIHWIHQQYDNLESELFDEIDVQCRRYTRSATQKIKYLSNRDQNTRGELSLLLQTLGKHPDPSFHEKIQALFQVREQKCYHVKSLYQRKQTTERVLQQPMEVEVVPISQEAQDDMEAMLYRPYGKRAVEEYMLALFGEDNKIYSKDFPLFEEKAYIMSFLALLYQDDRSCFYTVDMLEGFYEVVPYAIPQMVFHRKEKA